MSLLNLILLSATPIAGLGVLLGIGRFEKYVLEERPAQLAADVVLEDAVQRDLPLAQPEPVHPAAA